MNNLTPANGIGVYAMDFLSGMANIAIDAFETLRDFAPAFETAPAPVAAEKLDNVPTYAPPAPKFGM